MEYVNGLREKYPDIVLQAKLLIVEDDSHSLQIALEYFYDELYELENFNFSFKIFRASIKVL